ncbi:hypothetical protein RSAG8_13794, partial [Rhizoctonia solani AG-8 WAC10335]
MPSIPFLRVHVSLERHSRSKKASSIRRWSILASRAAVGTGLIPHPEA